MAKERRVPEFPLFFHLLKIPADSRGEILIGGASRLPGVQVLFPGASPRRASNRRGAPHRDAAFPEFPAPASVCVTLDILSSTQDTGRTPRGRFSLPSSLLFPPSLLSSLPRFCLCHRFPSALLRNVSPTTSCCHLIPEVDVSVGLRRIPGFVASYFARITIERRDIARICMYMCVCICVCICALAVIKVPFIFTSLSNAHILAFSHFLNLSYVMKGLLASREYDIFIKIVIFLLTSLRTSEEILDGESIEFLSYLVEETCHKKALETAQRLTTNI